MKWEMARCPGCGRLWRRPASEAVRSPGSEDCPGCGAGLLLGWGEWWTGDMEVEAGVEDPGEGP